MKAAVLHKLGSIPRYEDFPDPLPAGDQQVLISVKAASIKLLDKLKASGRHYTAYPELPIPVGVDGTGILADGTRVYAMGITGMFAQKALVPADGWVKLPDGIDFENASILPNALMGSDLALLNRGQIRPGQTVLINGATGVSGKVAIQMARFRGARFIIATGRNPQSLEQLQSIGADLTISLTDADSVIIEKLREIIKSHPVDIVLDYLWGHPAELLFAAFEKSAPGKIRFISVGQMAGGSISLTSGLLRSTQLEILGSGLGSIQPGEINRYFQEVLPEIFQMFIEGKLKIEMETFELKNIEQAWQREVSSGKRIVITI